MPAVAEAASDIIYARGVLANPSPEIDFFSRKDCSLILFEIGFCLDLGCQKKVEERYRQVKPLSDHAPTLLG